MKCKGSDTVRHISDYDAITLQAKCQVCSQRVAITIPDIVWFPNTGKFTSHQVTGETHEV